MPPLANPAAQAQAAIHRTELLIDQCRNGRSPPTPQGRWHAAQQHHFLAWLEAGGFAQSGPAIENSDMTPLFSAPQGT